MLPDGRSTVPQKNVVGISLGPYNLALGMNEAMGLATAT